ncbi:ATP-grasp fold amidoligase family protein [Candidatus Collinsella stercoripullorum]|uniref:ATP-grasp fold amidoligase family protein n=1 Tax=Candidatus Collinsella stercoripullorum TaxID=2838522 RepID=UPI0022E7DBD9|nr:ATP-grasp fold amidoligase family protein [Candidatus Collinsella stercoripullorum]
MSINSKLKRLAASIATYGTAYLFERACLPREQAVSLPCMKKRQANYANMSQEDRARELCRLFACGTGRKLDLDHPRTFNEKMQWLKLYGGSELRTRLIDKVAVKEWVAQKVGERYVVPLLGVWDAADDIEFDGLPERFVLKCNHGAGYNIIVRDKNKLDQDDVKRMIDAWMSENYAYGHMMELQYEDVIPKVFAEEYMENGGGDIYDYKIYCYGGEPRYTQFLCDRAKSLRMAYFDNDWHRLQFRYAQHPLITEPVERPENFDEMLSIARELSDGWPFVRVDLYRLDDGTVKFGEMTFIPAGGMIDWVPADADKLLGEFIELPY